MLPLGLRLRLVDEANSVSAGDDSYGLLRCQGFTVYGHDGRVGTVRRVEFGQSPNRSDTLVVRTGLFVGKSARIPTSEIGEISVVERRIILRSQPDRDIVRASSRRGRGRSRAPRPGEVGASSVLRFR